MGDKWKTSVNSCGPRHAAQDIQSGRQAWKTSVGDKCKLMRPKATRVRDKCGRQVGDKCKLMRSKTSRVGDSRLGNNWEISVKSCGLRHPE